MSKVNIYAHCCTQLNFQLIHICDKTAFSAQEKTKPPKTTKKQNKRKNKTKNNLFRGLMLREKNVRLRNE